MLPLVRGITLLACLAEAMLFLTIKPARGCIDEEQTPVLHSLSASGAFYLV